MGLEICAGFENQPTLRGRNASTWKPQWGRYIRSKSLRGSANGIWQRWHTYRRRNLVGHSKDTCGNSECYHAPEIVPYNLAFRCKFAWRCISVPAILGPRSFSGAAHRWWGLENPPCAIRQLYTSWLTEEFQSLPWLFVESNTRLIFQRCLMWDQWETYVLLIANDDLLCAWDSKLRLLFAFRTFDLPICW